MYGDHRERIQALVGRVTGVRITLNSELCSPIEPHGNACGVAVECRAVEVRALSAFLMGCQACPGSWSALAVRPALFGLGAQTAADDNGLLFLSLLGRSGGLRRCG